MSIPNSVIERTKRFEGVINHMYLDSKGFVTVGVGYLLPNADSASKLTFVLKSNGNPATKTEKESDWNTISQQEKNHQPAYYDQFAKLKLNQEDINTYLDQKLQSCEKELMNLFTESEYSHYPQKAQEALLDMIFNLGLTQFINKFPNLVNAVKKKDWKTAANECHRLGISESRNNEIKELFNQSVKNKK